MTKFFIDGEQMKNSIEAFPTRKFKNEIILTRRNALPVSASNELQEGQILATRRFLSGEIGLRAYKEEIDAIVDSGILLVQRPSDLRIALTLLGFKSDFIEENVSHEEKHWNVAQKLGFESRVGVRFVRVRNQTYFRNTLTSVDIPEAVEDDIVRQALRLIIMAPGEGMSRTDCAQLLHSN